MLAMIADLSRRFAQKCRRERAYRQLHQMDGRLLQDLGLNRQQIAVMPGGPYAA